jgi:hypothetical protein
MKDLSNIGSKSLSSLRLFKTFLAVARFVLLIDMPYTRLVFLYGAVTSSTKKTPSGPESLALITMPASLTHFLSCHKIFSPLCSEPTRRSLE